MDYITLTTKQVETLKAAALRMVLDVADQAAPLFRSSRWKWWDDDRLRVPSRKKIEAALRLLIYHAFDGRNGVVTVPTHCDSGRFRVSVEALTVGERAVAGFKIRIGLVPFSEQFVEGCATR